MKNIIFSIIFLSWLFILNSCSSGGGNPPRTVSTNSTITSFSINNATGIITGNKITVTMPYGTNTSSLIAKFTVSGAAKVLVGNTQQVSGITPNNFTTPQIYTLVPYSSVIKTSANTSITSYTVTVLIAAKEDKAITSFSLSPAPEVPGISGIITGHNITVVMPFGTNLSSLTATFTTTGESVLVGTAVQTSGTTANNFTNPVLYTVTAANGSTATYTVTVSVASKYAKEITEFSIAGNSGTITGQNISVIVPHGTNITSAIAAFTATGESVLVNSIPQISESSVNDFSHPVIYTVVAADKSSLDYTVTVTVAPRAAKALIDPFLLDGYPGTINESQLTIDVTVPFGTPLTNMITTFNTTGESVTVNGVIQTSDSLPSNNFESPVAYVVHAADASTATYIVTVHATSNVWTWMSGSQFTNQNGVYSEKGVASSTDRPGSRHGSVSWTDSSGNMWLFGGYGYGKFIDEETNYTDHLNDLWEYTPSSGKWTWMSGESTQNQSGIYGEKGIESQGNMPGAREGSVSWVDPSGNLWLFGGNGYGTNDLFEPSQPGKLNDLWKYNISSKKWTWISGESTIDQPGIYGEKGIEGQDNMPGGRTQSVSWADSSGNLWLFGGNGSGEGTQLNDLWKYNISSKKWTWMSGESTVNQPGIYGEKGIESQDNVPGGRYASISWIDSHGNLWLFGGYGYEKLIEGISINGYLNDLWKYTPSSGKWTWISGESTVNQHGIYGDKGIESQDNVPGGRYASISWIDSHGNLWLFGGIGFGKFIQDGWNEGYMNDLWKYDISSGKWVWISGTNEINQPGIYGSPGVPDLCNIAGNRQGSISWIGADGNLWLFGGVTTSYEEMNDLWTYNIP